MVDTDINTANMCISMGMAKIKGFRNIYEIDPLLYSKCLGPMKIIAFIEDDALIRKILVHLRLWDTRNHGPPQLEEMHIPAIETELTYDDTYSQLPPIDYWTQ